METLEELKNKYKKLQEESNNLYSKIKALEKRNAISKFTVGDWKKWMREEFLKDLWHHASEKPNIKQGECCVTCLVKFKNESTELCVYFRNPEGWVCDDMSPKDFKRNFKGWLYIDDLLPKKGD